MSLTQRIIKSIEERRQRILDGKVNCIPSHFKTFYQEFKRFIQLTETFKHINYGKKSYSVQQ